MGRKKKIVIHIAVTALVLILAVRELSGLMENKAGEAKYRDFFEQEEDFDVLFMGTSHVINGVFPMQLWKDYGIVSYNCGGHANQIATSYWVLRNALEYTKPKLVVIDCFGLQYDTKTSDDFSFVHLSMDAFPLSRTKIAAVRDLLDDPVIEEQIAEGKVQETEKRTLLGLLWDFSVYHFRWEELTQADVKLQASKEKGADSRIGVGCPQGKMSVNRGGKLERDTVGVQYLERMIQECRERGIEVLLTYLPFEASDTDWKNANRAEEIAGEYGIRFLNFLDRGIVDEETDLFDGASHLNPSGAGKVTDYLGRYIRDHYEIADQRGNPAYAGWEDDYEEYLEFKDGNLKAQESLDNYLMLLADPRYDVVIRGIDGFAESEKWRSMLENIEKRSGGLRMEKMTGMYASEEGKIRIDVRNAETGEKIDAAVFSYSLQPCRETLP